MTDAAPQREVMSWVDLGTGARDIAEQVHRDGYLPDIVLGISRGGLLVAGDGADTGATLALVKDFCEGKVAEVRCAVLYEKSRSTVRCEYVWSRTDLWIDFPWSAEAPVPELLANSPA